MANLPETAQWVAGIYQLEITDAVLAGAGGIDNLQSTQLANRTLYLKNLLDNLAAAESVADHEAKPDPHPQYLEAAHLVDVDPHPQYLTQAEADALYSGSDPDTLYSNQTRQLAVGYTATSEALASNTITPDLTKPAGKTRGVTGTVTINFPTGGSGYGACTILLDVDGTGGYGVVLGANVHAVGAIPALAANTKYLAKIERHTAAFATCQIVRCEA